MSHLKGYIKFGTMLLGLAVSFIFGCFPAALSNSLQTPEIVAVPRNDRLSPAQMSDDIAYTPLGRPLLSSDLSSGQDTPSAQLDFTASLNEPVYCLLDGVVKKASWRDENLGICVEIHHQYPGLSTVVGHLGSCCVKPGDIIPRGSVVGYAAQSGYCQRTKVSFFVIDGNKYIEPSTFLNQVSRYVVMLKRARLQTMATNPVRDLEFPDAISVDFRNSNLSPIVFKKWSADERQIISNIVERLKYSSPKFISLSTASSGLKFARASIVTLLNDETCMAATCGDTIVVSDKFFEETNQQLHCLTHELVHRADLYGFITYSREWITFAQPLISKFETMPTAKLLGQWPSKYACKDLSEALAEYATSYLEGQFFESKVLFDTSIEPMIFHPTDSQLTWCRLVAQAKRFIAKNQMRDAEDCLNKAVSMYPSKAIPYHYLAVVSARGGDEKATADYTDKFIATLNYAGLAKENGMRIKYVNVVLDNYRYINKKVDLLALVDHFLVEFPTDKVLKERRRKCLSSSP